MKANKVTRETILTMEAHPRQFPAFGVGDNIAISQWIVEGNKKRIQIFAGDVIAKHNNGISGTFTVRKICSDAVSVERIFPFHSPVIDKIEVIKRGKVRRAKLYYVRNLVGKKARIKERIMTKEQRELFIHRDDAKTVVTQKTETTSEVDPSKEV